MNFDRISYAFAMGVAFGLGRAWAKSKNMALDADKWITVKPNGPENKGRPVLIDEATGKVKGGIGGRLNGKRLAKPKKTVKPKVKKGVFKRRSQMSDEERRYDDALMDVQRGIRHTKYFGSENLRLTILRADDEVEAYFVAFNDEGGAFVKSDRLPFDADVSNAEVISKFKKEIKEAQDKLKEYGSAKEAYKGEKRQKRRAQWSSNITNSFEIKGDIAEVLSQDYKSILKHTFEGGVQLAKDAFLKVQPALVFRGIVSEGEIPNFSFDSETGLNEGIRLSGNYLARRNEDNVKLESDCAEFFHENGHHVDWALSSDRKTFLSDEENFSDTIVNEVMGLYGEYGLGDDVNIIDEFKELRALEGPKLYERYKNKWEQFGIPPDVFLDLVNDESASDSTIRSFLLSCAIAKRHNIQPEETCVFSDVMMPFIANDKWRPRVSKMGKTVLCLFHPAGYFNSQARIGRETFANLFEAAITNPLLYKKYAKIFPETLKEFERLLTL